MFNLISFSTQTTKSIQRKSGNYAKPQNGHKLIFGKFTLKMHTEMYVKMIAIWIFVELDWLWLHNCTFYTYYKSLRNGMSSKKASGFQTRWFLLLVKTHRNIDGIDVASSSIFSIFLLEIFKFLFSLHLDLYFIITYRWSSDLYCGWFMDIEK